MRILDVFEVQQVSGAIHINIGTLIATCVIGFVTAGPAGLGIALSGIVMNEGINRLDDMRVEHFEK
jgi:hypothetical protein